jgi:hypothetical protein
MFKKLKNNFIFEDYKITKNQNTYGNLSKSNNYPLSYDYVETNNVDIFFKVIPKKYQDKFNLLLMTATANLPAHTDSDILATINFYINTGEAKTVFYKIISSNPKTSKVAGQSNGNVFEIKDLEIYDSFMANNNEAYVLDITNPHSVEDVKSSDIRIAFVLQTTYFSYDEVCAMLIETNNL